MSHLAALQQAFQAYVLHGNDAIQKEVANNPQAPAAVRLSIYSTAYRLRLLEALQTDYTALHAALGDDEFELLCFAFIDASPSTHPNLRWFGGDLGAYLSATPPYADKPVLAELASFEWAMGSAFDAPDDACLTVQDIAAIPVQDWPTMSFEAHPSVQRLDLFSNAPLIWKAVDAGTDPPQPTLAESQGAWVVWRHDLRIFFRSMEADEAWGFDSLLHGATFAEICEGLCEWVEDIHVAQHAAGMLKGWVESCMIRTVRLRG